MIRLKKKIQPSITVITLLSNQPKTIFLYRYFSKKNIRLFMFLSQDQNAEMILLKTVFVVLDLYQRNIKNHMILNCYGEQHGE
jgi:hypothetical protein